MYKKWSNRNLHQLKGGGPWWNTSLLLWACRVGILALLHWEAPAVGVLQPAHEAQSLKVDLIMQKAVIIHLE